MILQCLGQDACLRPVFELIVSKLGHVSSLVFLYIEFHSFSQDKFSARACLQGDLLSTEMMQIECLLPSLRMHLLTFVSKFVFLFSEKDVGNKFKWFCVLKLHIEKQCCDLGICHKTW